MSSLGKHMKISTKERRKRRAFNTGPVICALCNLEITTIKEANWDHIIPKSLGGPDMWENLQLTHRKCNNKRGNNPLDPEVVLRVKSEIIKAIMYDPNVSLKNSRLRFFRRHGAISETKKSETFAEHIRQLELEKLLK
jgi:carbonic anhydrase